MLSANIQPVAFFNRLRRRIAISRRQLAGALTIGLGLSIGPFNVIAADRLAVPSASELKTAQAEVKELFKSELNSARSSAQLTALAERMLSNVQHEDASKANDYVLLTQALATAVKGSNIELSRDIVRKLSERYEVDDQSLTAQTLKDLSKGPTDSAYHQRLADVALELIIEATRAERIDIATQYVDLVSSLATKLKSADLAKKATAARSDLTELKKQADKYIAARKTLETNANDTAANGIVGRYELLAHSDWQRALPYLAQSDDSLIKAAAISDQQAVQAIEPLAADDAYKLANDWWDISQKQTVPGLKSAFKQRAGQWYEYAAPNLKALAKTKADQRLSESEWKSTPDKLSRMPLNVNLHSLKASLEASHGLLGPDFAICQTAKLKDALDLTNAFAKRNFRPTRFRPFVTKNGVEVAAIWIKDGFEGEVFSGSAAEVTNRVAENSKRGFIPIDVAGYVPIESTESRHVLVSVKQPLPKSVEAKVVLDFLSKGEVEALNTMKAMPLTFQRFPHPDGMLRSDLVVRIMEPGEWTLRAGPLHWVQEQTTAIKGLPIDVGLVDQPKRGTQYIMAYRKKQNVPYFEGHTDQPSKNIAEWQKLATEGARPSAIGVNQMLDGRYETIWLWIKPK